MSKAEIIRLAERVERLDGADREVDEAIQAAILGATIEWSAFRQCNVYHKDGRWVSIGAVPAYTASLDAAMGLVPATSFWRIGHDADDPSGFTAQSSYELAEPILLGFVTATAATPALALTSAALRAIAASMEDE